MEPFANGARAIFNRVFWDSTVLQPIDAALVDLLLEAEGSAEEVELIRRTAETVGVEQDQTFADYCREALRQMAHLGLIVTVDQP